MIAPDERVLRAVINLEASPDFQVIVQWLQDSYQEELTQIADVTEVHRLRWSQGRSQELRDLTMAITDARRTMQVLTRSK